MEIFATHSTESRAGLLDGRAPRASERRRRSAPLTSGFPGIAALVLLAGVVFATGCGGSSTSTPATTSAAALPAAETSGAHTSSAKTKGTSTDRAHPSTHASKAPSAAVIQHALTAFRGCVSAHGANPTKLADPAGRTAVKACRPLLAGALSAARTTPHAGKAKPAVSSPPRNHLTPALTAGLAGFAACMRADGINMPAPTTTGGAIFNTKGLDTTSARFKAAEVKCNPILQHAVNSGAAK